MNKEIVTCSGCGKDFSRETDVFQISSPYKEKDVHACQMCWNSERVRSFKQLAGERGIKLTVK